MVTGDLPVRTDDGALRRELGTADLVMLSVGGMVGSAIFVFPGATGRLAGPASILAWLAAGALMAAIALCYTELALAFPRAGGPAVYPYEAFGPRPTVRAFASYLEGICYSIGWAFGITVSGLAIANYAAIAVPAAAGHTVPIALVAIGLGLLVNLVGVDLMSRTTLVLAAALLAILLVFVVAGLAAATPANYRPFLAGGPMRFLAGVQLALTAYGAWTVIPAAAEEVRQPARTIPRAILLSLLVTTLLYTAVVVALHGLVPAGAFVENSVLMTAPLGTAAGALSLPLFERYLLPLAAIAAIFTTILVGTMSAGRVLFALGRSGVLPRAFAAVSDRSRVPWVGLVAITLLAGAFAVVPRYFYQLLVVAAIVGTGLPYAINVLSFVGLRYYRTDVTPPFRAPGGYGLAAVAFVPLAIAVIGLGATEVAWSVGALVLISAYFLVRYLQHPERFEPASCADA